MAERRRRNRIRKQPKAPLPAPGAKLRPSERVGAPQPPPAPKKQPSAEAMLRARARLNPPLAPWAPLPLAELAIVFGMLGLVAAAVLKNGAGMLAGFLLILIGTAEFSWREHRHGYRSHGAVLAGIIAMLLALVCWLAIGLPRNVSIGIGIVVFLLGWSAFTGTYTQRTVGDLPPDDQA